MGLNMTHAKRNRPTLTDVDMVPIVGYCEATMGSRVMGYAALTMENVTPQDIEGPPTPNQVKALVAKLRRLQDHSKKMDRVARQQQAYIKRLEDQVQRLKDRRDEDERRKEGKRDA